MLSHHYPITHPPTRTFGNPPFKPFPKSSCGGGSISWKPSGWEAPTPDSLQPEHKVHAWINSRTHEFAVPICSAFIDRGPNISTLLVHSMVEIDSCRTSVRTQTWTTLACKRLARRHMCRYMRMHMNKHLCIYPTQSGSFYDALTSCENDWLHIVSVQHL